MPDVGDGSIHNVGRSDPLPLDADRLRIDARHVEDVLKQASEAVELHDGGVCLHMPIIRGQIASQILHGDSYRRQWCSQIMAERREQRARQVRLLPHKRGGVTFRQELRPLDGNGDDAGDGVERADVERRRRRYQKPNGFCTVSERDDEQLVVFTGPDVASVRALSGVELQGAARLRQRRVEGALIDG